MNMAADEALLVRVGAGKSAPTLRLYQWDPPTISLGYFQAYSDYEALPPPVGELPVVRRLTGGGAILHDRELTYSLTLPAGHPLLGEGPNRLYEIVHEAVRSCLAEAGIEARASGEGDDSGAARGPFFCFARRHVYDLLIGSDKVAGSAQRRTRTAVLQHGSIVLARRYEQHPTAEVGVDARLLADAFVAAFAGQTGCHCEAGVWQEEERQATAALTDKYADAAWTQRC